MTLIIDMASGDQCEDNIVQYDMQCPTASGVTSATRETAPELGLRLETVPMETTHEHHRMPAALLMADIDQFLDELD